MEIVQGLKKLINPSRSEKNHFLFELNDKLIEYEDFLKLSWDITLLTIIVNNSHKYGFNQNKCGHFQKDSNQNLNHKISSLSLNQFKDDKLFVNSMTNMDTIKWVLCNQTANRSFHPSQSQPHHY